MERKGRTFVIMFSAVVPLLQRGVVLLIRGWDVEEFDVDGGGIEIAGCNGGDGGGDIGVDTGAIEVEVFNCAIGGGAGGAGGIVLVPEPTTTYKL